MTQNIELMNICIFYLKHFPTWIIFNEIQKKIIFDFLQYIYSVKVVSTTNELQDQ